MQYTEDSIWRKDIRILQPAKGYRFSLDAVLLGHFVKANPSEKILEIGAGTGIVSILVAALNSYHSLSAVEIQPELAELCRQNFLMNNVRNSTVHQLDARDPGDVLEEKSYELIYANPPYRKSGSGRLNPSEQKAIARHEIQLKLQDLFECSQGLLKSTGRLTLILPTFREPDFHSLVEKFKMNIHEWQYVHSLAQEPPAFFLATVVLNARDRKTFEPLIIYDAPGHYTDEMRRLLTADFHSRS